MLWPRARTGRADWVVPGNLTPWPRLGPLRGSRSEPQCTAVWFLSSKALGDCQLVATGRLGLWAGEPGCEQNYGVAEVYLGSADCVSQQWLQTNGACVEGRGFVHGTCRGASVEQHLQPELGGGVDQYEGCGASSHHRVLTWGAEEIHPQTKS